MKKIFSKVAILTLGVALAAGAGVALSAHKEAMGVSAAPGDEVVYKEARFGSSYNSKAISGYSNSWYTTYDGFRVDIANFNNNNNGWSYVKCGSKNSASVATLTTAAAVDEAITKVDVVIDAITAASVNSIKLYTSSNGTSWTEAGSYAKSTGTKSVSIGTPTANLYYKLEFDCAKGSSNGLVTVSKVQYYYIEPATTKALESISLSGTYPTEFLQGNAFSHEGMTVTAHFDDESTSNVTDYATFSGYNMAVAGEQTVTVSYTYNEVTKTTSYAINVEEVKLATYQKVTSALEDYSGDYLIVYEGDNTHAAAAFDGNLTALDAIANTQPVTITEGEIVLAESYEFHITAKTGGYSVRSSSGKYIGTDSYNNELKTSDTDTYTLSVDFANGIQQDHGEAGVVTLKFNASTGQLRFRFYKTGQQVIALYKKVATTPAEEEADTFAQALLDSMTCNDDGASAPTTVVAWSTIAGQYEALSQDAKDIFAAAEPDAEGSKVEEALARYEMVVAKYGYDDFMNRNVAPAGNVTTVDNGFNATALIIVVTAIALASVAGIVTVIIIRRRRFHN